MAKLSYKEAHDIVSNMHTVAKLACDSAAFNDCLFDYMDSWRYEKAQDHLRGAVAELEQLNTIMENKK